MVLICTSSEKDNSLEVLLLDSHSSNTNESWSHFDMQLSNTQGMQFQTFKNITVPYLLGDITQIIQLTFKVILKYYCSVLAGKLLSSCNQEFDSVLNKKTLKMQCFIYSLKNVYCVV